MSAIILIYSKYSSHCDNLQYKLNKHVEYKKLCIDNQNVREHIKLNQSTSSVVVVPTLFIFHENGESDRLEGEQCFDWVNFLDKQAKQAKQQQEQQEQQEIQEQSIKQEKMVKKENVNKPLISVDDISFEETNERKLDSSPLIRKEEDNDVEDKNKEIKEMQAESSMQKNNSTDNIMNLAQQLQKQRELEDGVKI